MTIAIWVFGAGIVAGLGFIIWGCLGMASLQDDRWEGK